VNTRTLAMGNARFLGMHALHGQDKERQHEHAEHAEDAPVQQVDHRQSESQRQRRVERRVNELAAHFNVWRKALGSLFCIIRGSEDS